MAWQQRRVRDILEKYSLALLIAGKAMASRRSAIRVTQQYEFGQNVGLRLILFEVMRSTIPDSSVFYADGIDEQTMLNEEINKAN